MDDNEDYPYDIGYGKPPKHSQFEPGQSGNRRGRPKGATTLATAIEKELNSRVVITKNGKRKTISKKEAIAMNVVNKAATGDIRSIPLLLKESAKKQEKEADERWKLLHTPISDEERFTRINELFNKIHLRVKAEYARYICIDGEGI